MNETKIKNEFEQEFKKVSDLLIENNTPGLTPGAVYQSFRNVTDNIKYEGGTCVRAKSFDEKELLFVPLIVLLKQKNITDSWSDIAIENRVIDFYHRFLQNPSKKEELIENTISTFMNSPKNEYKVASELENIKINDDIEYKIINSVIKTLEKNDIEIEKDKLKGLAIPSEELQIYNTPSIITTVKANDESKAKELALYQFKTSLNLLKLYFPEKIPCLKGESPTIYQKLLIENVSENEKKIRYSKKDQKLYIDKDLQLNIDLYKTLKEFGIEYLKESKEISKSRNITDVVMDSLYWFSLGLEEKHYSAKLLNFVTVLEASLKKEGETNELARLVGERGAVLLEKEFTERKKVKKELRDIYKARSKIVHTGKLSGDKDLAQLAQLYAREVLIQLINKSESFNGKFEKFIENLDDIRLGKENDE